MSDEELKDWIEAAQAGDEEAVRRILEQYGQQVRRTVGRRMGPALRARADSEDVLQSAMVFALANLADFEFRGEAAFVGWLSAIAAQQVGQLVRHHGAQRRDLAREQRLSQAPPLRADDTTASQVAGPGTTIERACATRSRSCLSPIVTSFASDPSTVSHLERWRSDSGCPIRTLPGTSTAARSRASAASWPGARRTSRRRRRDRYPAGRIRDRLPAGGRGDGDGLPR